MTMVNGLHCTLIVHEVMNGYVQFPTSCVPAGTVAEGAPIVPISAQLKYNIEVICEYISKKIPVPMRDFTSEPRLIGASP